MPPPLSRLITVGVHRRSRTCSRGSGSLSLHESTRSCSSSNRSNSVSSPQIPPFIPPQLQQHNGEAFSLAGTLVPPWLRENEEDQQASADLEFSGLSLAQEASLFWEVRA